MGEAQANTNAIDVQLLAKGLRTYIAMLIVLVCFMHSMNKDRAFQGPHIGFCKTPVRVISLIACPVYM